MRVRRTQKKRARRAEHAGRRPRQDERQRELLHQDAGHVRADAEVRGVAE